MRRFALRNFFLVEVGYDGDGSQGTALTRVVQGSSGS